MRPSNAVAGNSMTDLPPALLKRRRLATLLIQRLMRVQAARIGVHPAGKSNSGRVAGPIKSPGQLLVGAASDRTPSFSVCTIAVELGPHHGTPTRYPCPTGESMGIFGRGPVCTRRPNFALAAKT